MYNKFVCGDEIFSVLYGFGHIEIFDSNFSEFVGNFGEIFVRYDSEGYAVGELFRTPENKAYHTEFVRSDTPEKTLYIVRGVPGSGKTTLANKLTDLVCSADDFMVDRDGNYDFSTNKLGYCHKMCKEMVIHFLSNGNMPVAVANTFTRKREYSDYIKIAEQYGYTVQEIICRGNFKNVHGVDDETMQKMIDRFEY